MFPSDTSDVKGDDSSSSDDSTTLPPPGHAEPGAHGQRHSSLQQSQSQLDSASASASQPSPPSAELSLGTGGGGGGSGGAATVALAAQASGPGRPRKRYVGVRQRPSGRWVAEIKDTTHKIRLWLGTFNNPEDAARAYDDAARTLRGANTRTNFARTAGSRSGFSSNSVRLLLQRAVEAAAVAGTLDSGGLLPSAAAAAAAAAAGSGSTSGSEQVPSGLGYDRSVAAALSDSSELEEQVQERGDVSSDYSELDPLFAAHARSRHRGETSHSSTVMSLAQQASSVHGLPPTVVAPGSQLRAYSGLAPLDQRQVLKAGLVSGYSSAAYVESDSQLVEGGKPDQGGSKNYHASHVLDIYESLREKLGCRAGSSTDQSPSTMQQLPPNGSTGPSFNPGLGEGRGTMASTTTGSSAGDMGRGSWEQTPSDRDLSQWSRTRMHEMQDHMPPVSAAQSIQGSWDRNQAEDGSCDLEELGIPSVNPWGDVGSRILAHDHDREEDAERMEGIASLNWDDLGQAAEQTRRPIELGMSTMKWSRNADGPQGMEGIESWGSMHMEGGDLGGPETAHISAAHAPTISRSSWTPNTGSGHDQLQFHNQWLSSGPGAPLQMLDPGHSQGSSDHGQIHSTGRGERELHNSAHDLNPLLQHQSISGNRSSYDYLWASSAMASPPLYVPSAFMRHIARAPFPYAAPEAGVVMENSGRQESAYRGMTTQDSNPGSGGSSNAAASAVDYMRLMSVADPNDPGHHQRRTSIFPPNESEHGTDGELNFLLSSPGFFRMDSFPRHEVQSPSFSAPDPTATRDTALNLFRASQAGATTVQVDSAFSAASLEAQRPPPVAQASDKALQMQNHLKELSNMPMARHTDSPDRAGADPIVRPSLQRTNAACLVEIVEDAGLDKEAARTR